MREQGKDAREQDQEVGNDPKKLARLSDQR